MAENEPSNDQPSIRLFIPTLNSIPEGMSTLLSDYSGIATESQINHVLRVRNDAYKSWPYPCLGRFRFLELDLTAHPLYTSEILATLKSNPSADEPPHLFLDLGCCLAQDLRKLAYDGVPVSSLYGADLQPEFINAGYELFRDEAKIPRSHFISPADVLNKSPENSLHVLDGMVTILNTSAFFHLFDLQGQKEVALRCLKLLNPKRKRAMICGCQIGNVEATEIVRRSGQARYRHNEKSWKDMWEEVTTSTAWKDKIRGVEVQSILREREFELSKEKVEGDDSGNSDRPRKIESVEKGFRWMVFTVWVDFV